MHKDVDGKYSLLSSRTIESIRIPFSRCTIRLKTPFNQSLALGPNLQPHLGILVPPANAHAIKKIPTEECL